MEKLDTLGAIAGAVPIARSLNDVAAVDLDGDGVEYDLEVIWNMTSGRILKVMYNRYDYRPFVLECYQDQAHTWVGLGVMQMSEQFERMATGRRAELGEITLETMVPISEKPEDISIIVAGGPGSHSVFVPVSAHTRFVGVASFNTQPFGNTASSPFS